MSSRELYGTLSVNTIPSKQNAGEKLKNCLIALVEEHALEDKRKAARLCLKVSGAAISAVAKIPFIPIALKLGKFLGPISVVGNTIGFFILEYWAIAGAADDLLGAKTHAERELLHDEKNGKKKKYRTFFFLSSASIIALFSQLPAALMGMEYNPKRFQIVAGTILLVAGSLIPIRSLQLSTEQLRHSLYRFTKSEISKIKIKMIDLIRENQELFIQISKDKKGTFIAECNQIRHAETSIQEKTNQYVLTLLKNNSIQNSVAKKIVAGVFSYAGTSFGTLLAGIFEYALGEYTFSLTKKELWDNDVAASFFTALALGSTAYLFGTSIIKTTQRIFSVVGNIVTGKEARNLSWQLRPKLSFALTAIGLLIDICALGPTYVIWGDFYNQNNIEHQFFQKTMSASLFLLLFTSTLDIIDDIVKGFVARGSAEEQEIFKINEDFKKFVEFVQKSHARELVGYLMNLNEEIRDVLLERMRISADRLAIYVKE